MHVFKDQNPGELGFTVISHPKINQNSLFCDSVRPSNFGDAKKRRPRWIWVTNNVTVF